MTVTAEVQKGDCLELLKNLPDEHIDLIYLDPPFFTEKVQKLKTRDRTKEYSYSDIWGSHQQYGEFLFQRICQLKRVLKNTGSIFVHCDRNAAHIIRAILDDIFGENRFQSEIIWSYKRWSNAKKGLLPSHQTIYFYSKSNDFKFHTIYKEYSETTNIDQILQKRARDKDGKAIYARNEDGSIIGGGEKKGVPLGDVWEIPYLNPKAKERVGYPTQKPLLLLERIISMVTDRNDLVLDPFCGSGTTLVAAKLLQRNSIGMDLSEDAISLTKERLSNPIKTDSNLLKQGRQAYLNADKEAIALLEGLDFIPVQRNKAIDAILKQQYQNTPVLVRVQKRGESVLDAAMLLSKAAKKKGSLKAILVIREEGEILFEDGLPNNIEIVESVALLVRRMVDGQGQMGGGFVES
ncbi:MAG: site-specific DNA-methyltransferase [Cyanobacteriota bacterium]|nr:site-specific DNA-methyltransferase [Cyanobacteriota bacterium]